MIKREIKRQLNKYGKYLDILLSFVLVLIFTVPIMVILNLSPIVSAENSTLPSNVLGVKTGFVEVTEVKMVGGSHSYIQNENLYTYEDNKYLYSTRVLVRDKGVYSKPIFTISVPTDTKLLVKIWVADDLKSTTQIGILLDKTNYVLKEYSGMQYIREILLSDEGAYTFSLDLRNENNVNFPENIDIHVTTEIQTEE